MPKDYIQPVPLQKIREILRAAFENNVCAKVFDGPAQLIYLEFAKSVLPREVMPRPEYPDQLFFRAIGNTQCGMMAFFSHWWIIDATRTLVDYVKEPPIELVAAILLGRRVTDWELEDDGALYMTFDALVTFQVNPIKEANEDQAWAVYTHKKSEDEVEDWWNISTAGVARLVDQTPCPRKA